MGPDVRIAVLVPAQVVFDLELALLLGGLGLLIAVGLIAVIELRRRMTQDEEDPETLQSLEHYEALRDQGLLDPDEFERIRDLLERRDAGPPPTPPAAP